MKINLQNYEMYFVDYLEGNLNPVTTSQVKDFLEEHPELKAELKFFETSVSLIKEAGHFQKSGLIRTYKDIEEINDTNFEEHCIAYYEGDLDSDSKNNLLRFITGNVTRENLFQLYSHISFSPDKKLILTDKSKLLKRLRKRSLRKVIYLTTLSAAAILALFVARIFFEQSPDLQNRMRADDIQADNSTVVQHTGKISDQSPDSRPVNKEEGSQKYLKRVIAAFDTSDSRKQEIVVLAMLDPRQPNLKAELKPNGAAKLRALSAQYPTRFDGESLKEKKLVEGSRSILVKQKDELIFGAVSMGIKGFNNLTENNLAIVTDKDQLGNIQSFRLGNERFGVSRIIRRKL